MQTCLVQKDDEIKAMEASHAALISQLQQELELLKKKEDALGQLEEQSSQTVAQLQNEKEKAYKLLEDVSQENVEILKQLEQEKEERVKIEAVLNAERGALQAERKDHERVKSEVLKLQTELQQIEEEKKSIMSRLDRSLERVRAFS